MARNDPPKRPEAVRLGLGTLSTQDARGANLRALFLQELDHIVPQCRADLIAIFEGWPRPIPYPDELLFPWEPLRADLEAWARRWRLTGKGGVPAEWVLHVAAVTCWQWQTIRGRDWSFPAWGGPIPSAEDRTICDGKYWADPAADSTPSWKLAEGRGKRFNSEYEALLAKYRATGHVRTTKLESPEHMAAVVGHQVLGRARLVESAQVRRLKSELGLSRPKGRPKRQ